MLDTEYQRAALHELRRYRGLAERAIAQTSDSDFFAAPDPETNSIAVIVKHMAGNMHSRWTDFLTTDGEKPDRDRDREFMLDAADTREALELRWIAGWDSTIGTVETLQPADFQRIVTIRGESHLVLHAISRQVAHYSYHVGQIVLLAKHYSGSQWQSLSIPRGQSQEFNISRKEDLSRDSTKE